MFDQDFEELKLTGNLPSPPGIGLAILRISQSERATLEDLVRLIRVDPAISGRLIMQANEASLTSPVTTVECAASILGLSATRSLALAFSLVSSGSGKCDEFDYDRFWALSLCSALCAEELTSMVSNVGLDPASAYTCALFSRIGMLALATVHSSQYSSVLLKTRGCALSVILEAEAEAFEITHPEVTAAMMSEWGLPLSFPQVTSSLGIQVRESPHSPSEDRCLLDVLNVAWRIAPLLLGDGGDSPDERTRLELACCARLSHHGFQKDQFAPFLERVMERAAEWLSLLRTGRFRSKDFENRVSRAKGADATRLLGWTTTTNPSPASFAQEYSGLTPLVLVVDDDQRIVRLLAHLLERDGFRVASAPTGEEALSIANELRPQILITDWTMPGLTGLDLCRELKRRTGTRDCYVIMLTAREEEENVVESFDAGADDYVCKPFKPMVLLSRVRAGFRVLLLQKQVDRDRDVRARQVAEMGAANRKLRSVSLTDVLTELPNRRFARQKLDAAWQLSDRRGEPLSIILLDVDHFKSVNDEFGHDVGDQVLSEVAAVLKANVREGDVVCRFGGEEFVVITQNTPREVAYQCAERLRHAVATHVFSIGELEHTLTVSLGVATRTPRMARVVDLLKAADQAVYGAKAVGRDRTVVAGDDTAQSQAS